MTVQPAFPAPRVPPTAPGLPLIGHAATFIAANGIPVEFLQQAQREYGDLVHFKIMNQSFYLVASPDLVRGVLLERVREFERLNPVGKKRRSLARFMGRGILTAPYEEWRPQRKLIQPLMHAGHIREYPGAMGRFGEQLLARWHDGEQRDIHADMTQVTMWIIADTMFGISVEQSRQLESAVRSMQKIAVADLVSPLPAWATRREREAARANAVFSNLLMPIVAERRAHGALERHDLLSLLLETRDEDGELPSDEFVRDNVVTMFLAGHETTANTLTWAFYYLSQLPPVLEALQAEVDAVIEPGAVPTLDDLPRLPYTLMVIKETMRIQPIVATIPRVYAGATTLGGYRLEPGATILLSPYLLHHDPRLWPAPGEFDPERFLPENEAKIPKYGYLPFGGGPRICIGNHFSLMEAQILLALMVRRFRVRMAPGKRVEPLHQVTTSPKDGLQMIVERRRG